MQMPQPPSVDELTARVRRLTLLGSVLGIVVAVLSISYMSARVEIEALSTDLGVQAAKLIEARDERDAYEAGLASVLKTLAINDGRASPEKAGNELFNLTIASPATTVTDTVLGQVEDDCQLEVLGKIQIPTGLRPPGWIDGWVQHYWVQFQVEGVDRLLLHTDGTIEAATDCGAAGKETP